MHKSSPFGIVGYKYNLFWLFDTYPIFINHVLSISSYFLSIGCVYIGDDAHNQRIDADGDNIDFTVDCDDQDSNIGIIKWYKDKDGDGYGNPNRVIDRCEGIPWLCVECSDS